MNEVFNQKEIRDALQTVINLTFLYVYHDNNNKIFSSIASVEELEKFMLDELNAKIRFFSAQNQTIDELVSILDEDTYKRWNQAKTVDELLQQINHRKNLLLTELKKWDDTLKEKHKTLNSSWLAYVTSKTKIFLNLTYQTSFIGFGSNLFGFFGLSKSDGEMLGLLALHYLNAYPSLFISAVAHSLGSAWEVKSYENRLDMESGSVRAPHFHDITTGTMVSLIHFGYSTFQSIWYNDFTYIIQSAGGFLISAAANKLYQSLTHEIASPIGSLISLIGHLVGTHAAEQLYYEFNYTRMLGDVTSAFENAPLPVSITPTQRSWYSRFWSRPTPEVTISTTTPSGECLARVCNLFQENGKTIGYCGEIVTSAATPEPTPPSLLRLPSRA